MSAQADLPAALPFLADRRPIAESHLQAEIKQSLSSEVQFAKQVDCFIDKRGHLLSRSPQPAQALPAAWQGPPALESPARA